VIHLKRDLHQKRWSKTLLSLHKGRFPFCRADIWWIWRQSSKCVP
jgi:hypothetical protein